MKARVVVGPVDVRTDGTDLTVKEIRALMRLAADIALAVLEAATDDKDTPEPNPIGFTAQVERADNPMLDTLDGDEDE